MQQFRDKSLPVLSPDAHSGDEGVSLTLQPRFVRVRSTDTVLVKHPGVAKVFQFDANLPLCRNGGVVARSVFVDEIETSRRLEIGRLLVEALQLWRNLLRVLAILRDRFSFHVDNVVVVVVVVVAAAAIVTVLVIVIRRSGDARRYSVRRDEFCRRKRSETNS